MSPLKACLKPGGSEQALTQWYASFTSPANAVFYWQPSSGTSGEVR